MTIEEYYEVWMFDNFTSMYCKDYIIEMCQDSLYWEVFLEEIGEDNDREQ